jgi:TRAP-type transport system periplasmic protein
MVLSRAKPSPIVPCSTEWPRRRAPARQSRCAGRRRSGIARGANIQTIAAAGPNRGDFTPYRDLQAVYDWPQKARKSLQKLGYARGRNVMDLVMLGARSRMASVAGAFAVLLALTLSAHAADDQSYVMKLGLATINDAQHEWCKRFVAMVEKDTGGKIKGEIYPASQLGPIPREIEGVQFGAIQGYVGPPEFLVGVDDRFEVLSAPGLVTGMAHGIKVASDPQLQKTMFSLGADKGIHGVALFVSQPSSIVSRTPIRHLADLKGKKLRVLAADMQQEMLNRLGASPIAMTLGDVLPAIQQGTIDGAVLALTVDTTMRYYDAAKYITETNQPFIFSMAFLSKKWFDGLPNNLQTILDTDARKAAAEVDPWEVDFYAKEKQIWAQHGEIINLPANEQAEMMTTLEGVGQDVVKRKPELGATYAIFAAVAKKTK